MLHFEWDPKKATSNARKHGVTFQEAATVFLDPLACIFDDEEHSIVETREIIIGHSSKNRLILVSFVERMDAIRIISARKADRAERNEYNKRQ